MTLEYEKPPYRPFLLEDERYRRWINNIESGGRWTRPPSTSGAWGTSASSSKNPSRIAKLTSEQAALWKSS